MRKYGEADEQFSQYAQTDQRIVRRDVVGGRRRIVHHKQLRRDVNYSKRRGQREQVQQPRASSGILD
jgi:hypothetical protein